MDQLRKEGWFINESQTSEFFEEGILPKTSQEIVKTILNEDLRHFGEASIINLQKKEESVFDGPCVLQLLRYRNVSVPRIKEELNQTDPAHSIIRLFFTDGHTSISAVVLQTIPGINSDTPPGTKIQINGTVPIEGNFLILDKKNVKILGGRVEEMIEKWNVEKSSVRADGFKSSVGKGTGAPKWVSFGKRGQKGQLEKGFKANSVMPKNQKEGDEADDFSKNRAEILKELDTETAKTFAKPNLAPPPVKAPPPPKERQAPTAKPVGARPPRKGRGRKNSEDGPDVDVGEYANHKPSGPATLFDFIGGGGEKGAELQAVIEKTSKLNVSSSNNEGRGGSKTFEKKFDNNKGGNFNKKFGNDSRQSNNGGASGSGGKYVDREQRPPRNDVRGGPAGSKYQSNNDRNPQSSKNYNQSNQGAPRGNLGTKPFGDKNSGKSYENSGKPQGGNGHQKYSDRPNTGPPAAQSQSNPRGGSQQHHQQNRSSNNRPNYSQGNSTNNNYNSNQTAENPRQQSFRQNPQHFHQGPPQGSQNFQRGPPQNPRVNFGQGQHQNFQREGAHQNPRGNQQFQGAPRGNPKGGYQPQENLGQWQVGSQCLSTWTDGNLYPATITQLLPDRQAVVRYNEYGNMQTVPVDFLIFQ
ncbi:hypothetical protein GCK72_019124 [Caenorhabditis remanei]|uniref:Survival of motor neuron-related-splicing factor 30 n=1 Tax=Caenorhabditis remanei TaxID=31234 RepID=A0A6A5GCW9_CAERE|nr:hypothetical protein GCK72_019119 [Caenorhabditis remanei]XP_053581801.1 hypothetical protein GCK72_019124 [Caenorhabditis remanei]KAF1752564.1 hypothetical protein GCK72_019119 [Caenorhabditis remanei]KAF1752569.1 hypothetical protein GCK72_019124 [Caenorhabditis remanei]